MTTDVLAVRQRLGNRPVPVETANDLYEYAPCGYLSTLPDGRIIRVNQTFLDWTGYSREDLAFKRFVDLLSAPGKLFHETHYAPLLRMQGFVHEIAFEIVRRDRPALPALVNAVQRCDADGEPELVRISIQDATDRRTYERELLLARRNAEDLALKERVARAQAEQALQARDEFLVVAAHELKTPIAVLLGQAQLSLRRARRDGAPDPDRTRAALEEIEAQSRKLQRLVEELLDLSRVNTGDLRLNRVSVDLAELVRDSVNGLRLRFPDRGISVDAPASHIVVADGPRLERVLTNLLDNAVKYSPSGSPVHVTLSGAEQVEISVRDFGRGVPEDARERIFDRFGQAQESDRSRGFGLGLYLCRQIVGLHGGTISVEAPDGGGSRFVVRLPGMSDALPHCD